MPYDAEIAKLAELILHDDGPGISDIHHVSRVLELATEIQLAIDTWCDAHQAADAARPDGGGPCPECNGIGKVLDAPARVLDGHAYMTTCVECKGTGRDLSTAVEPGPSVKPRPQP